jgi:hypothetical protein
LQFQTCAQRSRAAADTKTVTPTPSQAAAYV